MKLAIAFASIAVLIARAAAIQVGESREQIAAKHGLPVEANHAKDTAIYRQGPWKIDVAYKNGVAWQLIFTKTDALTEAEISAILSQNCDVGPWHELKIATRTRHWQGSGAAMAQYDPGKPRSLIIFDSPLRAQKKNAAPGASSFPVMASLLQSSTPTVPPPSPIACTRDAAAVAPAQPPLPQAKPNGWLGFAIIVGLLTGASRLGWRKARPKGSRPERHARVVQERVSQPNAAPPTGCARSQARTEPTSSVTGDAAAAACLDTLSWDSFELLVGEIYRRKGYKVAISSALGADGGQDLILRKDGRLMVVQCKKLARDNRVTASQMRDFFGLLTSEGASEGYFVTTGYFSADAKRFAEGKPIMLIDWEAFDILGKEVSAAGENLFKVSSWIDSFAADALSLDPKCPFCLSAMKLRTTRVGKQLWGCTRFAADRCKGVRDIRPELVAAQKWQNR